MLAATRARTSLKVYLVLLTSLVSLLTACSTPLARSELPKLRIGQAQHALGAPVAAEKVAARWVFNGETPTTVAQANVFKYDSSAVSERIVAYVARSFGLHAPVVKHSHGFSVTDPGALLQVRDTGQWVYSHVQTLCSAPSLDLEDADPILSGSVCSAASSTSSVPPAGSSGGSAGTSGSTVAGGVSVNASPDTSGIIPPSAPQPPSTCLPAAYDCPILTSPSCPPNAYCLAPPMDLVSDQDALNLVSPILKAAHLTGAPNIVNDILPAQVSIDPLVEGKPTYGMSSTFILDHSGILSAQGQLGELSLVGDYPLISASRALDLLNSSSPNYALPLPAIACPEIKASDVQSTSPISACGQLEPTALSSVSLGLELQYDGLNSLLVPAWLYSTNGDSASHMVIPALAIDPTYVTSSDDVSVGGGEIAPVPIPASTTPARTAKPSLPISSPASPVPSEQNVEATAYYSLPSDRLAVSYWAGDCHTYSVRAVEDAKSVLVFVTQTPLPNLTVCDLVARSASSILTLHSPLGPRLVFDGASKNLLPMITPKVPTPPPAS